MPQLEQLVQSAIESSKESTNNLPVLNPNVDEDGLFAEPNIGGRVQGLMTIRASAIFLVLGVVLASTVGGYLTGILPGSLDKYAMLIAGIAIIMLGRKSYMLKSFGFGVFVAGLVEVVKGLGILGRFTAENRNMYAETRETYGGTDGVYPTQPDRPTYA